MCNFLSSFRIGVSPSYFNKKSAELGKLHNVVMLQQKNEEEALLKSIIYAKECLPNDPSLSAETTSIQSNCSDISTVVNKDRCEANVTPESEPNASASVSVCRQPENLSIISSNAESSISSKDIGPGWKIAFDNLDIFQRVRHIREENQNRDHHWINHIKVTNRVSGNHLPDDKPICNSIMELDNAKIIPTYPQHIYQRGDYVLIIERILTEEIPCLAFCRNVVTMHIPHCHSSERSEKSEKVCAYGTFHLLKSKLTFWNNFPS